jgi:hypothetical protein
MQVILRPLIAATLVCVSAGIAGAQTQDGTRNAAPNQDSTGNGRAGPTAPGNGAPGLQQPPRSGSSTPPGSLSNQLNRSGGVLPPPSTGDQGVVAPPNQGMSRTPVIPPPGTPGGNPEVQPK